MMAMPGPVNGMTRTATRIARRPIYLICLLGEMCLGGKVQGSIMAYLYIYCKGRMITAFS